MKRYITIDGGTTNTRLYLVESNKIIDTGRISIGSNSQDSKKFLSAEIKKSIVRMLSKNGLKEADIHRIIASGMITSEFGLCTLEHTVAPTGIAELHNGAKEVVINEISSIPFCFICGVKTVGDSLFDCNMMRGEETELMGLIRENEDKCIYVLPGSHSKIIRCNVDGQITDFKTTITGEMIAALSKNTLLSSCVNLSAALYTDALLEGYKYTELYGINESLLKTRVLKTLMKKDESYTYSFFMGCVLHDEIKAIISMDEKRVVIAGRAEMKHAIAELLRAVSDKDVTELDEESVDSSTSIGAIKIFEYNS